MRQLRQTLEDKISSAALTFRSRCSMSFSSLSKLGEEASERKDDFDIVATMSSCVVLRVRVDGRCHWLSFLMTFEICMECWKTLMTTKMVMMMVLLDFSHSRLQLICRVYNYRPILCVTEMPV
mmetsp:Transcript_7954/g.11790  ORF Transcript_7954/g.11790 Transcript_7954/m.11790 type:complete len:123 (-) Transcript_7954:535-903(-)